MVNKYQIFLKFFDNPLSNKLSFGNGKNMYSNLKIDYFATSPYRDLRLTNDRNNAV